MKGSYIIRLIEGTETLEGTGFYLKAGFTIYVILCLGALLLLWEKPREKEVDPVVIKQNAR